MRWGKRSRGTCCCPSQPRLDPIVLNWLKSKGEGHLTRINDILTNLMEMDRRTGSKS